MQLLMVADLPLQIQSNHYKNYLTSDRTEVDKSSLLISGMKPIKLIALWVGWKYLRLYDFLMFPPDLF